TADVSVRLESGSALLEVVKIDKPNVIRITAGKIKTRIESNGVFRFSPDFVSVIEGKLKIEGTSTTLQKGWQTTSTDRDSKPVKTVWNTPQAVKSFLNSPKAGFVNAIVGQANFHTSEVARSDQPIQTGPSSYAEVLLRPGAFMRIDENSSVVLEST